MHESEHGDGDGTRPEIMGSLPRTRPQRRSDRRANASPRTPIRDKPTVSNVEGDRRAPKAQSGADRPEPAQTRVPTTNAPGFAELAVSGAVEAAKLPIKVGAQAAFKTLDAITRSLRSR